MRDLRLKHFALLFSVFLLACQETGVEPDDPGDPDMEMAWEIANEFLSSSRTESNDTDVTVIKFKKDELSFKTNTIQGGYNPIDEMTVTAETENGSYVFWHAGGGVKELLGIEMDEESQDLLGDNVPFEVVPNHYWALWIPNSFDEDEDEDESADDVYLKYDIVYKTNSNEIVRLDPKIQVKQNDANGDE